jgi:YgiT-type zinc finger domain-containing protein
MKSPETCFECNEGQYEIVVEPYESRGQDGNIVVVPDVTFYRCTACGEELIPAKSARYISSYVAEVNEQLTKAELYAMLEKSGLSQKDYAEAIGLGEKTFHRWLKGTQIASRSMGYYLRALEQFPEVFAWVKDRGWRTPTTPPLRIYTRVAAGSSPFIALVRRSQTPGARVNRITHINPATAFTLKAIH